MNTARRTSSARGCIDWDDIETVVFDVDGTLYDQRFLRLQMARLLLASCLADRRGWMTARAVLAFRRCREELAENDACEVAKRQYEVPASRLGVAPEFVQQAVDEWIETRPLPFLRRYARPGVHQLFEALRASGRTIAVFSDYPARRKLAALGLAADICACAPDADVDRLKPNPAGLRLIMEAAGTSPRACLVIGDRPERDGEAARRAGSQFLLIGKTAGAEGRGYTDPIFAPVLCAGGSRVHGAENASPGIGQWRARLTGQGAAEPRAGG